MGAQKINDNIHMLRRELNITQKEMASLLGIKQATWSKKENGKVPITASELEIIADRFGVTFRELSNLGQTQKKEDNVIDINSRLTKSLLDRIETLEEENRRLREENSKGE